MTVQGLFINLTTVRQWTVDKAAGACLAQGITAIVPWRDRAWKIGLAEAARVVHANGQRGTGLAGAACRKERA
jgi:hypothetical protein